MRERRGALIVDIVLETMSIVQSSGYRQLPYSRTLALFRNLRNHRWEGYSPNAFLNDCRGFRWFFPNSTTALLGVRSLATRVEELMNWWHSCQQQQQQQQSSQSITLVVEEKARDRSQEEGKKEGC